MAILCLNNNWALYHLDGTIDSTTTGELLLHFDNSLEDSGTSNSVVTAPGTYNYAPTYTATTAPLTSSTHALYLNTSDNFGDFLVIPTSVELQWPGDFTVDFWMKWGSAAKVSSTTWMSIISSDITAGSYSANVGIGLTLAWNGANRTGYERTFNLTIAKSETNTTNSTHYANARFEYYGSGTNPAHVSDADLITDFHHIAICRTDGLVEIWMGGIKLTVDPANLSNSDSTTELVAKGYVNSYNTNGTPYYIGRENFWSNAGDNTTIHANDFHGYIDELRFVRGRAEFSGATFTVPAEIYGLGRTSLNNNNPFGQAGELELVGTPLPVLNSSVKQFSSDSSINLDGKNGLVLPYSSTETNFGAGPFTIDFWVYYDTANHPSGERTLLAHGTDLTLTYDGSPVGHDVGNLLLHFNSSLADSGSGGRNAPNNAITAPGANNSAPAWIAGKWSSNAIHLDSTSAGDFLRIPYGPVALFHFDGDVTDAGGGTSATIGGASLPATQYVTPTDLGYTNPSNVWVSTLVSGGFGKSIHIAGTSGTSTPMNFLEVPNPVFGTGAITIEFFVQFLTDDRNQTLFTWIDGTNGVMFYTNYHYPYGASDTRNLSLWNNDAGTAHYCNWDIEWDSDLTKSKHYALQRSADSGGYAQWDLFIDGDKIAQAGTVGSPLGNLQTVDITGTEHFQFGSYTPTGAYQGNYYLDELRVSKSLVYSGSTYTVPIAPFSSNTDLEWDGDFTVEFWVKFDASTFTSSSGNYHIIIATDERSLPSPDDLGFNFGWHGTAQGSVPRTFFVSLPDSTNLLRSVAILNYYGSGTNDAHVSDADMQGNYNHIAICRTSRPNADSNFEVASGVVQAWLNGIEMTQTNVTNSAYPPPNSQIPNSTTPYQLLVTSGIVNSYKMDMYIGRDVQFAKIADDILADAHDFAGKIDEFRIIKGTAMYSGADWSADLPTAPYGSAVAGTLTTTIEGVSSSATGLTISTNAWHHFGIVRDTSGSVQTYLDGVLKTTIANVYQILYDFNGNINDSSGHGRHGTTNSTTYTTSYAGNIGNFPYSYAECNLGYSAHCPDRGYDKSLELNGSSEFVTVPDTAIRKGDYTIEFWWKNDGTSDDAMISCGFDAAGSNLSTYLMYFRLCGGTCVLYHENDYVNSFYRVIYLQSREGSAFNNLNSQNGWRHYAIEREYVGNGLSIHRFYFDGHELKGASSPDIDGSGVLYNSGNVGHGISKIYPPADINPTDSWILGKYAASSYWADGQFDDFRISHYARYGEGDFIPPTMPQGTGSDNKKMIFGHAQDEGVYIPFNNTTANLSSAIVRTPGPTNHNSYAGSTFSADSPYNVDLLFHFDDNYHNSGAGTSATNTGTTFQPSTVPGTGFGKQINFGNTAAGLASQYLTFPDPSIGTSAFTFECWFNSDVDAHNQIFFSDGSAGFDGNAWGDVSFTTRIEASYTNNKRGFGLWNVDGFGSIQYVYWGSTVDLWTAGQGMKHIALVRGAANGVSAGKSQWRLYYDGNYIAPNGLGPQGSSYGDVPTVDMGGQAHQIGRIVHVGGGMNYAFDGQMDEIRITMSDTIYTGTTTYPIPTAPFTAPTTNYSLVKDVMGGTKSDYHHILGTPTFDGAFTIDFWMKMDGYSSGRLDSARTFTSIIATHSMHQTDGTPTGNPGGRNPWESGWVFAYRTVNDTSTWGLPNKFHLYQHQGGSSGLKSMVGCAPWSDAEVFDALESWNHVAIVRYTNAIHNTTSAETGWKVFINGRHWHHTSEPTSNCSQSGNGANAHNTTVGSASQIQDPAQRGWLFGGHNSSTAAGEDTMFGANNFSGKMAHLRMTPSAIFPGGGFAPPTLDSYPSSDTGIRGNIEEVRVVAGEDLSLEWLGRGTAYALYHFEDGNNTITDSVGSNHGTIVGTPDWSYPKYVTNAYSIENIDAGGWGDQIQFANDSGALNYATVPNPSFGTGAFTIEFWHRLVAVDTGDGLCGFLTGGSVDSFMMKLGNNSGNSPKLTHTIPSGTDSDDYLDASYNYSGTNATGTPFVHWALVRTATVGGNQEWRLYINGDHRGSLTKGAINTDSAGDFLIGYNLRAGLFDSFRISKSELYFGTGTYTVPTGPLTPEYPLPPPGDALYNFNSIAPLDCGVRAPMYDGVIVGAPDTGAQFVTNHASIGAPFGNQLRLSNPTYTGTIASPGNLFKIPNHGIGAGNYTIEFWYDPVDAAISSGNSATGAVLSIGYDTTGVVGSPTYLNIELNTYNSTRYITVRDARLGSTRYAYFLYDWLLTSGTMRHWALCREVDAPNAGDSRQTLFINGVELSMYSGNNYHTGIADYDQAYNADLFLGISRPGTTTLGRPKEAVYDSVMITRSCKYPTGSPPTPPTAPFAPNINLPTDPYLCDCPDYYYNFDTGSSELENQGPTIKTLTTSGSVAYSTNKKFGAKSTDLSSGYLIMAYGASENMSGDFTIQMWLKFSSTTSTQIIFEEAGSNGNRPIFSFIGSGTPGAQTFEMAWGGVSDPVGSLTGHTVYGTGSSGINTTDWYHLSVTFSSGTIRTFFHGEYIGTDEDSSWDVTFPSSAGSATSLEIGVGFTGLLDELLIIDGNLIPYSSSSYALAADPACGVDIGCTVPIGAIGTTPAAGAQVSDGGTYTQVGQCDDSSGGGTGGWNNNSTETFTCAGLTNFAGTWTSTSSCNDPDECQFNATRWGSATTTPAGTACGLNNEGYRQQVCTGSTPSVWANNNSGPCSGTDVCTNGQIEYQTCGSGSGGTQVSVCSNGAWGGWGACQDPKGGSGTTCHNDHTTSYTSGGSVAILVGTTLGGSSHAHAYTVNGSGLGSTGTYGGHHHEIIGGVVQNLCIYASCQVPSAGSGTNVPAAGQTVVHGLTYLETGQCNINGANGGYNSNAERIGTCNDGTWDYSASNGTCTDPDACIFDAIEGCEGTNCNPNCDTSPSKSSVRKCASSTPSVWGSWSTPCQDTDGDGSTCHDHGSVSGRGDANGIGDTISDAGNTHSHDFDVDGSGIGWTDVFAGHHHKIVNHVVQDFCTLSNCTSPNGVHGGNYTQTGQCNINGDPGGYNGNAYEIFTCNDGTWVGAGCVDPDDCTFNSIQGEVCDTTGTRVQVCSSSTASTWGTWSDCQNPTGGSGSSTHNHTISGSGAASGTTSAASSGDAHTHAFTVNVSRTGYTDVVNGHHHAITGDIVANFNSTGPALITCSTGDCTIVGECYTKEYGTVKLSWDIDNSEDHELTTVVIVRAASNNSIFPAKTVTLSKNYFKNGFISPYVGEWTDADLVLPMDCTADETFTYTVTLNSTAPGSASSDSFTTGTITIPCCACTVNELGVGWAASCLEPIELELLYHFKAEQDPYIKDETSNFNHGRARGGAIIDTTVFRAMSDGYNVLTAQNNSSLRIPGEGSYVSIPHHPSLDFGKDDDFTIDFWIYFNVATTPDSSWSTIFQSANYRGNKTGFRLTFNSGDYYSGSGTDQYVPYFRFESCDGYVYDPISGVNISTGEVDATFPVVGTSTATPPIHNVASYFPSKTWHHVQISRWASGAHSIVLNYHAQFENNVNGNLPASNNSVTTITEIYHGDDGIEIGSSSPGYPSFDGYIDLFRIQRTATSNVGLTYLNRDEYEYCPELDSDPKCWDSQDSKLSIWMEGYFENPITGRASFDLKYYLNEKCAWGIGDTSIYFNLPNQANITAFTPNNLLSLADCTFEEASNGGQYPGRWKLDIAHPAGGDTDVYKEINPIGYDCSDTKVLFKFNKEIDTSKPQHIINHADRTNGTVQTDYHINSSSYAGTSVIDSTNKKFGESSLNLNYFTVLFTPAAGSLTFTGALTIDFWVYSEDLFDGKQSATSYQVALVYAGVRIKYTYNPDYAPGGTSNNTAPYKSYVGSMGITYSNSFPGSWGTTNHFFNLGGAVFLKNKEWNHVALVREDSNTSNIIKIYCNGLVLSQTSVTPYTYPTGTLDLAALEGTGPYGVRLGQWSTTGIDPASNCNIDEFRISSGARWTANFNLALPAATTACHEMDPKSLLPPTHGAFGTVEFDKPIGQGRVCFDVDETKLEVWSREASTAGTWYGGYLYQRAIVYDSTGNLAKDYNVAGLPKWQTGPCLSTCTDEVEMGYGDFYFKPKPYDNNTVDVEYCLTRDEANTFMLACITTDFKTNVSAVDAEFGDAVDYGWDIKVKNICPGFSIVYGHGTEPITNSGYNTLIRLYLDNQVIQKHHSDPNAKVCMFPLFMSIDESLFATLDSYIAKLDSPEMKNLRDSKNAGGELSNDYETPSFYYNGAPYGSSYSSSANNILKGWQKGSGFLADLHLIADKVDKRFKQLVHYLADAFEDVIKDYSNTDDYVAENGIRNSAIETAHSFRILYLYWSSLLESYPELKSQFDSYSKDLVLTENDFHIIKDVSPFLYKNPCLYRGLDVGFRCDKVNNLIYVDILYNFPLSSISGVEINLKAMISGLAAGVAISDTESWDGDARNNNYLQAFSAETKKYICVYGGNISASTSSPTNNYLRSDISQKTLPILTTIVLKDSGGEEGHFNAFFNSCGEDWNVISNTGGMDDNMSSLYQNIITSLWTAKFVSNENTTDVVHYDDLPKWTGNSYKASIDDNLDVRDLLTTVMLAVEPNGSGAATVNLSETNIEAVMKLPIDAKQIGQANKLKSVKEYYNLPSLDLTGITYSTISDAVNGKYPWVDSDSGKRILSTIDVSNDGVVDIVDVVALRNVWTALGEYPATLQQMENTILPVVPSNPCTVYDADATLFSVDDCSTFCITDPDCFSKVWISDMILIRDAEDNPTNYLLEVSYSVDAFSSVPEGMVLVPEGSFYYGPPAGSDNWTSTKTTEAFYIDKYEVTAGQYKECVDAGACTYTGTTSDPLRTYNNNKDNHPINYVTPQEAMDYCTWKGKRLPTELEWEKAARGTDGRTYPWGEDAPTCDYAVMNETGLTSGYGCGTGSTWEVGQKPEGVSPYGAYDMAGNVYEWVSGFYGGQFSTHHIIRGSAFTADYDYEVWERGAVTGTEGEENKGFRCAQSFGVDRGKTSIEDFSGIQFRVEGLDGEGILGIETGTGTLDQVDATAAKAQEWSENILALDTIVNDSYYGFSTNGRYISKGKGVLCYLKISADSIPDREGVLQTHIDEGFIVTNKFKKFETNPIISALEDISGERVSYPLANLRFKSHHTDELMIYERFGIRAYDYKVTHNNAYDITDLTTAIDKKTDTVSSWTGGTGATTASSLDYVLKLAATNNYELIYDSNASGKIDIVDVQTIAHILNNSVFGITETSESATLAVPKYVCLYEAPSNILLGAIDYTETGTFEVVRGNNVKTINVDGTTELNCNSPLNYTGGVALYWEPISDADYYTVYRQGAGEEGIPIISSTTGIAGNITSFTARPLGNTKAPMEISSTLWVDFPPIIHNKCEETDADTDPGITAEEFKYWVVATNRFGTSTSTIKQAAVVNCRRLPDATDITFIAQRNNNFFGKFNVDHPFAVIPIGSCDTSCFPVWTYAQNSGGTNVGISNKEGSITTKGSKPAGTGTEGQNDLSFTYKPKKDFIGKDTFKYTAKVLDPESINNPAIWCFDEAEVTIYVIPEPPDVKVKHDACPCPDTGEDQDITLTWEKIDGAKAYNVYEYNPNTASWDLKQTVDVTATDTSFEITLTPAWGIVGSTDTTWATWAVGAGCVEGTSLLVQYRVSSVSMVENMEMENVINNIDITKDYLPCCVDVTNPTTPTATKGGYCDPVTGAGVPSGVVTVAWNDATSSTYDYDTYNVYRRGPYLTSGDPGTFTPPGTDSWEYLDEVYSTGATLEYKDNPDGCYGCPNTSYYYKYYVTSVNNALCMEGAIPAGNPTGVEVGITCCNVGPDVVDQTEENNLAFETEFEVKLEGGELKAYDPDSSIASYSNLTITVPSPSVGTLTLTNATTGIFDYTPAEGWYRLQDGLVTFTWVATDNCGATSTATADIIVKPPPECLEYDYIICNAQIPWLTDQQDIAGIRKKIASLTQVPFMLNSKGVPSLRRRCGAYTVTRGLNPSVLALADDDCDFGP